MASMTPIPDPGAPLPKPWHEPVTGAVAWWAGRTPAAPAVCQADQAWNYEALLESGSAVARALLARGVERGEPVAVAGQPSFGLVAGILGVLLSGGVLLTLDRSLPPSWRRAMLELARARYLLVSDRQPWSARLAEEQGIEVIAVDPATGHMATSGAARSHDGMPLPTLGPDDPAYLFFTSGTTGMPKGVLGRHTGLSHFLAWEREMLRVGPGDRVAQLTGLSFDVVLRDIFLPLTSGATLCLPDDGFDLSSAWIMPWLEREKISLMHTVPALAHSWLGTPFPPVSLHALRWVLFAGEPLTQGLVQQWRQMFPESGNIGNLYGPTETTLAKFFYRVPDTPHAGVQPVGQPLPQTQGLVVTPDNHLCEVGEAGEIVIRTPFRSLGYLNNPEETRRRFVKNPFRDDDDDVLYYTGDRGRYRADGALEILGRLDHQVKIRGVRIESQEVEGRLNQHPAVRQSVVIVQEYRPDEKRLVAYAVPHRGQELTVSGLRRYMQEHLPDAMVPAIFMLLDAMPLTPNGKVDRNALPTPDPGRAEAESGYVAPRTPTEASLAEIWGQVLGLGQVGVEDNFFDLGGHSLLATQVLARLRRVWQVELPLRTLFEAPTIARLAAHVDGLRRGDQRPQLPALLPVAHEGPLPLSFAQQRLWFLHQLEPGAAAYNMRVALYLQGPLHVAALRQSLGEIVRRHEVFRTTFGLVADQPVQVVASAASVELPVHDLSSLPEVARRAGVERLATAEAQRPFDLAHGPLLRARLLRTAPAEHMLLLTMHHIVSDEWSGDILLRELAALYTAFAQGQPSPLPALPVQYADFALWQRAWLQGEELERQLAFWRQRLAGAPAALNLPTDRPRPAVQTFRGASQAFLLPPALATALGALSRREGVTLFMALLAAFQTLLARYTGQTDIAVGTPIANRRHAELEGLIGFFVNTLVLRTDLSGDPTFRELLGRVREVALDAYTHQDLPFERLVEELQPARSLGRTPLFQILFVLQNAPRTLPELPGVALQPMELETTSAKFDVTLSIQESAAGLLAAIEYNTDLFDAATITRMAGHFRTLLCSIVADPERRLSDLPLLTDVERRSLVEWNDTAADYPRHACVHQLVEEQAARTPDAVAAVFEHRQLTYRQLDERANQLAHRLRSLGAGPGTFVGVCVERSLELAVSLLAILKAGAAYVPLDPTFPSQRLAFMLRDAAVPVLLTQQSVAARLPTHAARPVLLDREAPTIARQPTTAPAGPATPAQLAYVIYTSGSTGTPKGVAISHRSVVNLLHSMRREPGISAADTLLAITTIAFDIAALELFLPLTAGARLVVAGQGLATDGALAALLADSGATILQATPATWRLLLAAGWPGDPRLTALCGGEALPLELAQQLLPRVAALWNLYGPTETTIWSTACRITPQHCDVPIGRPIANTQIYVLDERQRPVPTGVPGDLYIGGLGLAQGYLHRPELTAERFVPHPFSAEPGGRLYRTGDRARYRADGVLEFLGRRDHQIKIRGFRIELGEIESVLLRQPGVTDAAVTVREDRPGDKRLVAYYVAPGPAPGPSALRCALREALPEYMVPAAFVALDALPLTPNRKVDRNALPAPDSSRPEPESGYVAPRTPTEASLAEIWGQVLGLGQVGAEDNFFDLGGHSLLATQVLARLQEVFGAAIPLRALFEWPTLDALARRIEMATWAASQLEPSSFDANTDREEELL